jgi:hypothetical protein
MKRNKKTTKVPTEFYISFAKLGRFILPNKSDNNNKTGSRTKRCCKFAPLPFGVELCLIINQV